MARKKMISEARNSGGEWLHTYAGTVTLLLTFFILLSSMSSLDAYQFNMLVSQLMHASGTSSQIMLSGVAGGGYHEAAPLEKAEAEPETAVTPDLREVSGRIERYAEQAGIAEFASVSYGDGYVFVRLADDMLFEPNSTVLNQLGREILQHIGSDLRAAQNQYGMISVHGHTAAIPDGAQYGMSDRMFSSEKANAVLAVFEDVAGIDSEKLFAIGWDRARPLGAGSNSTEEGRRENGRVEILISTENLLWEQLDNIYAKLVE